MKHSLTYKLAAVFLSLLVVFSSLSFSIEKHFCEGESTITIFSDAKDLCEMESHDCHVNEIISSCCNTSLEKANCCIATSEFIEGITLEQQAQSRQVFKYQPIVFLTSLFITSNHILEKTSKASNFNSKPLLKSIDIGLILQVFRI